MKLIETLKPSDAKRRGDATNGRVACCVAYYAAMRDNRDYCVGPTYYGFKIGNFPATHPHYVVKPNGEIWRVN